jgi:hypothetical protein
MGPEVFVMGFNTKIALEGSLQRILSGCNGCEATAKQANQP